MRKGRIEQKITLRKKEGSKRMLRMHMACSYTTNDISTQWGDKKRRIEDNELPKKISRDNHRQMHFNSQLIAPTSTSHFVYISLCLIKDAGESSGYTHSSSNGTIEDS